MTKFLNKFEELYCYLFLVHFPSFQGNLFFQENPALSRKTSYGILAPYQNFEKNKDTIPIKRPDRQKEGRTVR